MAAGEGQGEDWQAFLNLGDAEDEEAPPALAAQPALVENDDDNDLPPPAHAGIDVPPALPVLPQGEVLGMIGELVDPVGPAAAHGADPPPVHGADEDPAPLLPPPQQQPAGVPPIGGLLVGQPAVVMLMQQQDEPVLVLDEPLLVLDEQALKALEDDLVGHHGPAAADDGADLPPVDGVPAPPLAPPPSAPLAPPPSPPLAPPPSPQQQQQPVPEVLIDDVMEEDLDEASEIWNEQKQQALKALEDGLPGQHGPAAADDGADLPLDGVPAPPLAPPPPPQQQQQQPVPVVLIDDVREEDLDVASEIWNEQKQQALKRPQNEVLVPAPAKRPAMAAMDMSAPPAPPGGGGGSDIVAVVPSFPMIPGFMHSTTMAHPHPPQVALLGPGIGGIMHSAMPSNFDMKGGDPRGVCTACPPGHGRIQHQSKVCGYTEPPNALSQHYCLCEPCQDRPPLESLRLRYVHCRTCREWFRLKQAQGPQ